MNKIYKFGQKCLCKIHPCAAFYKITSIFYVFGMILNMQNIYNNFNYCKYISVD